MKNNYEIETSKVSIEQSYDTDGSRDVKIIKKFLKKYKKESKNSPIISSLKACALIISSFDDIYKTDEEYEKYNNEWIVNVLENLLLPKLSTQNQHRFIGVLVSFLVKNGLSQNSSFVYIADWLKVSETLVKTSYYKYKNFSKLEKAYLNNAFLEEMDLKFNALPNYSAKHKEILGKFFKKEFKKRRKEWEGKSVQSKGVKELISIIDAWEKETLSSLKILD
jgi:hypothetical protein